MINDLKRIFSRELQRFDQKSQANEMGPADYANLDKLCSALKKLVETDVEEGDEAFRGISTEELKELLRDDE